MTGLYIYFEQRPDGHIQMGVHGAIKEPITELEAAYEREWTKEITARAQEVGKRVGAKAAIMRDNSINLKNQ